MRIGLVAALNARPLDWGFRQEAQELGLTLVEDTPARLAQALFAGRLDTALISSIECWRHQDTFAWCDKVGVAAARAVKSILYFSRQPVSPRGPSRVFVDAGSRSSTALLQVLLAAEYGHRITVEEAAPEHIPTLVKAGQGGMLIGDHALRFAMSQQAVEFEIRDLAQWWWRRNNLPFVFALWAYPKSQPIADDVFTASLDKGLIDIAKIAAQAEFPDALEYLTRSLHYRLDHDDLTSLRSFWDQTRALGSA